MLKKRTCKNLEANRHRLCWGYWNKKLSQAGQVMNFESLAEIFSAWFETHLFKMIEREKIGYWWFSLIQTMNLFKVF